MMILDSYNKIWKKEREHVSNKKIEIFGN
jgi:hypothetical protein